jgi:hypothetical protein
MTTLKLIPRFSIILLLLFGAYRPTPLSASGVVEAQFVTSKDEDYVKSACRLWWNLPTAKTNSAKDLQVWAKKVRPTVEKAVSDASNANKIDKKWSQFQLEMVTFWGSITLGEDIKYSKIMGSSTLEKNAIKYLSTVCKDKR